MSVPIIITRPAPDGMRFADQLRDALGPDIPLIHAPLMAIEPIDVTCDATGYVFTSGHGVAQAVRLGLTRGPAWCVGDHTARQARAAGFDATSAVGDAEALIKMIVADQPELTMAHIRGTHARGDIAPRLRHAGIACDDVIAYRQVPLPLPHDAKALVEGANDVIIPLFSPRTTELLLEQATPGPSVVLIAISQAASTGIEMEIAERPDGKAMLAGTIAAFRRLNVV